MTIGREPAAAESRTRPPPGATVTATAWVTTAAANTRISRSVLPASGFGPAPESSCCGMWPRISENKENEVQDVQAHGFGSGLVRMLSSIEIARRALRQRKVSDASVMVGAADLEPDLPERREKIRPSPTVGSLIGGDLASIRPMLLQAAPTAKTWPVWLRKLRTVFARRAETELRVDRDSGPVVRCHSWTAEIR